MTAKNSIAAALKTVRKARGLGREAFPDVSSRTYLSSLERDLKSPTLNKIAELREVMEIHPLTLLTKVRRELEAIWSDTSAAGQIDGE